MTLSIFHKIIFFEFLITTELSVIIENTVFIENTEKTVDRYFEIPLFFSTGSHRNYR